MYDGGTRYAVEDTIDFRYYLRQGRPTFAYDYCKTLSKEEFDKALICAYQLAIESFQDTAVIWLANVNIEISAFTIIFLSASIALFELLDVKVCHFFPLSEVVN